MFAISLFTKLSHARQAFSKAVCGPRLRQRENGASQSENLETRRLPAAVSGGNLEIVGSNNVDNVRVDDVTIGGTAYLKVNHNGFTQYFNRSSVYGQVRFWGYGSNDRFDYYGTKSCLAYGGTGNDFLSADRGNDQLFGGDGNDVIQGWGGNDELVGGNGHDSIYGGDGNDRLFGEAGNDFLSGQAGDDIIVGGAGLDTAYGGTGRDQFWEVGNDRWWGSSFGVKDAVSGDSVWS